MEDRINTTAKQRAEVTGHRDQSNKPGARTGKKVDQKIEIAIRSHLAAGSEPKRKFPHLMDSAKCGDCSIGHLDPVMMIIVRTPDHHTMTGR